MNFKMISLGIWTLAACLPASAQEKSPRAFINGEGPGWVTLGEKDFADVNGTEDTWKFEGNLIKGTGVPVGVMRTAKQYKNLEMVLEWRHLKEAGNSGVFVWVMEKSLTDLKPGQLPRSGIEVQALDHGYATRFEKQNGKKSDWFTTNGDVFAVGESKMKP
ncbi:MAG: family 16 glycoside hydrolase, partial [Pirellulaceae bacterium]